MSTSFVPSASKFLTLATCLLLLACQSDAPPATADVETDFNAPLVYKVVAKPVSSFGESSTHLSAKPTTVSGTVISQEQAQPSSKTGGVLSVVNFNEGDDVRRGQVLARVNPTELNAGVAQAEAGLEKAQRDLSRVQALFADSVATRTQRDDALTGVEVAQRRLESLKYNQAQTAITAPISGRIIRKLGNRGETLGPGMPVAIIQGTATNDWRIRVGLTDAQWAQTKLGQTADIQFEAYPGQSFQGQISERAAAADPMSATFPVELKMRKQPPSLAVGLIANVALNKAKTDTSRMRTIPIAALGKVNGKQAVVFITEAGKAAAKNIQLGNISGEYVEVLNGLSSKDTLIVTSVPWLRDGDFIQLINQ